MLEVRQTNVLRGPNVWARMPVIHQTVDLGELEDRPSNKIPGFYDKLVELIPSLYDHGCSIGRPGGFLQRLADGTWMGHVLEHVAIELQNLAGAEVRRGLTRGTGERGVYNVVYQYEQEDVGLAAGALALRMLNHLIYDSESGLDFQHELESRVIRVAEERAYGPSTSAIVSEAQRRGIPVIRLDPVRSLVQLGHGRYQRRVWATVTSQSADIAVDIASNKELTNRLLHDVGIPVPRSVIVQTADQAVSVAERVGYPIVLKPLDGNHGRGVCINLRDETEVREAFVVARDESRDGAVVAETYIVGRDYRFLVVNNHVVAVAERVPAHVIGDGVQTIGQLVETANADPRRGVGHEKILTRITLDEQTDEVLERAGMSLSDIPEDGAFVQLKLTGNMSTGGTSIDRTDDAHPDNVEIARQAAMVVGLDIAGIDFIAPDISQSVRHSGGAICEVNAGPGFRMHTHPTEGHPRLVGRAVMEMMFPTGSPARVPIVAVTGTNGKTTTSRMIAHIMKTTGRKVGLTSTDGVYIDGTRIMSGDMSGPTSAQVVLKNPSVDFAVLETARGGIIRSGLGFDRCDVAVVTNVTSDHLGLKGVDTLADLAKIKAVVPQSVFRDGASILNADNEWTVEMQRTARGEIVFFSMDEDNPVIRDHLRERGKAVILRKTRQGDMISLIEHRRETSLLYASQIPATFGGKIRVNIANALAATAAAFAMDVQLEQIRLALRTFDNTFFQTPGRFNMLELDGRRIVMDYCHNVAGLEGMVDFVQQMQPQRAIAMIAMPGDRSDSDIEQFGQLAGQHFDQIVIREDRNTRGRDRGDVARRLRDAALRGGMDASKLTIIPDEIDASHATVDLARRDDLVILLVDQPTAVWESLSGRPLSV